MRTDDLGLSGSLLAPGFVEKELRAVLIRFGLSPANHNAQLRRRMNRDSMRLHVAWHAHVLIGGVGDDA